MKQTLSLLKVLFKQSYRKGKSTERSKKGKVGMAFLYLFCIVVLAPYLFITLHTLATFAISFGAGREYMSLLMFGIQGFALIFGTISLVNIMFLSKDNEIISSLPIPNRRVFTAKFIYVLLHELLLGVVIGFAGVGIYGVLSSARISFYVLGALAVVISPILSLAISSVLLLPIVLICAYLRRKPIISGIISLALICSGMIVYMNFIFGISSGIGGGNFDDALQLAFNTVASKLVFNMIVADVVFLSANFATSLLYSILLYVGLFLIACFLTGAVYKKASTLLTEKGANGDIKSSDAKSGIMKALLLRDIKSIIRFPMLLMMCGMQVVISPIMIFIISQVYPQDVPELRFGMVFMMGIMFVCGMNNFASSSFSRENESINILKTIPVSASTIVSSKFIVAFVASLITNLLVAIVLIAIGMDVLTSLMLVIAFALLSVGIIAMQIKCDLDKPRLGWTNVNQGLKNNKASVLPLFLTMGIGMLGMYAVIFISMLKPSIMAIIAIIVMLLFAIFSLFELRSLYKNADKLFAKIEY